MKVCVPFAEVERLLRAKDAVIAALEADHTDSEKALIDLVNVQADAIELKDAAIVALTDELTRMRAWIEVQDR